MHTTWQLFGKALNAVQNCSTTSTPLQQQLSARCCSYWYDEVVVRSGFCSIAPILSTNAFVVIVLIQELSRDRGCAQDLASLVVLLQHT